MRNSAENHYDILSPHAPQMPKPLPKMLHLAIKNAPYHMKVAISNSLFPAFGSLMHNVGFRYPDNVFHEPHFMCGLIGPMSIGKGSINPIIETIIQPLLLSCAGACITTFGRSSPFLLNNSMRHCRLHLTVSIPFPYVSHLICRADFSDFC